METRSQPVDEPRIRGTRLVRVSEHRQTRPIAEGESFEDAAADSLAFLPDAERPMPTRHVRMSGCGRGRGTGRWFNMVVETYSDGSVISTSFQYEEVEGPQDSDAGLHPA